MKLEQRDAAPLSLEILRRFFAYNDWANERVLGAATRLSEEALHRTLAHIAEAEQWWLAAWTGISPSPVRPIHEIRRLRDDYVAKACERELSRVIRAQATPGLFGDVTIAQTMLQLCNHGTHHRALALNMLRHLGAEPIRMDYLVMMKEQQGA